MKHLHHKTKKAIVEHLKAGEEAFDVCGVQYKAHMVWSAFYGYRYVYAVTTMVGGKEIFVCCEFKDGVIDFSIYGKENI